MEFKEYLLGTTLVRYLIDDNKNVALQLLPNTLKNKAAAPWNNPEEPFDPRRNYTHNWELGSLVHFHLAHQPFTRPGMSMQVAKNSHILLFDNQTVTEENGITAIVTTLKSTEGYTVRHTLTHHEGLRGFEVQTEFLNQSGSDVTIDMLTSFVLDGLSPFHNDDAPNTYRFHRFHAGWSLEGKHVALPIEEMGLEKPWISWLIADNNERFGSLGSYPVERYFPTAVFEDTATGVLWAAQIAHNATWQMELGRIGDYLTFCGGLGDREFCGWKKVLKQGESIVAPKAFVAVATGDIDDACAAVTDMQKPAQRTYGEQGLPTSFNEYCATWGTPTQEKMMNFCRSLKEFGITYLVIDAGWCKAGNEQAGNGEWLPDPAIFPDMKAMNQAIRAEGMIPGIWFEFECTTEGSLLFEPAYDFMKLKRDGYVVKANGIRSFWDFRREDVREHLYKKVIAFLREYGFGYIKVDYNANIGPYVDGDDSGAEALRQHLNGVREFFELMKKELPDLVIENCASGGHRLEPSMMGVSAISSFSDAHECIEIPYIAANLHRLMLPAQSLVWATLHSDDSDQRLIYSLAATFLGRVCLSGPIHELNTAQRAIVKQAMDFYAKLTDVLQNGDSRLYGNRGNNTRHPTGTQVLVRRTDKEVLVVCHAYESPSSEPIVINLEQPAVIADTFGNANATVENGKLTVYPMDTFTASAVLLNVQ